MSVSVQIFKCVVKKVDIKSTYKPLSADLLFTFIAIKRNCPAFWEIEKKTDTSLICGIDYP